MPFGGLNNRFGSIRSVSSSTTHTLSSPPSYSDGLDSSPNEKETAPAYEVVKDRSHPKEKTPSTRPPSPEFPQVGALFTKAIDRMKGVDEEVLEEDAINWRKQAIKAMMREVEPYYRDLTIGKDYEYWQEASWATRDVPELLISSPRIPIGLQRLRVTLKETIQDLFEKTGFTVDRTLPCSDEHIVVRLLFPSASNMGKGKEKEKDIVLPPVTLDDLRSFGLRLTDK
ncbi:hypothetical protein MNV49_005598 [Pseudohyphozyma bogoriensis]|nr:hypothetical protein MNV49_005598 [Pseudohyphozyma bogoriensis]